VEDVPLFEGRIYLLVSRVAHFKQVPSPYRQALALFVFAKHVSLVSLALLERFYSATFLRTFYSFIHSQFT
jgi:hypothetical protein